MAITQIQSAQLIATRGNPLDTHNKLRFAYGRAVQVGAGDAGSLMELIKLPPGPLRVLPYLSRYTCTALGASRTLDFGHLAYDKQVGEALEAADPDAFVANIDASSAITTPTALSTVAKFDMYSRAGITITAQVNDGTLPDAAVIDLLLAYLYE